MCDPGRNLSVLIVDDEGTIIQRIRSQIERLGYRIAGTAGNGDEAVEKALILNPDVVLMDLKMVDPQTGKEDIHAGIQATRKILRTTPAPVIVFSEEGSPALLQEACAAGAGAFLIKPPPDDELIRAMAIAVARYREMMQIRRINEELLRVNIELQNEVNERKMTELVLRRQGLTFEHMYDGVIITDNDYRITDWNPAAERIFGYRKHEVLGRTPDLIHKWSDRPLLQKEIEKSVKETDVWRGIIPFERKDGCEGCLDATIVPLRDGDGNILMTIGVNQDITDRKIAERELAREQHFIQSVMDHMPDAIFVKDTDGRYVSINQAGCRRLGISSTAEIQGKTDFDLYARQTALQFQEIERRILRTGKPLIEESTEEIWSDGSIHHIVHTRIPLKDENGLVQRIFGVLTDTTVRAAMEAEQSRHTEALERSNRELEHFAALASHDLQEPLRKIRGFIELFKAHCAPTLDTCGQEYLDRIADAAARLQTLISNLLAYDCITQECESVVKAFDLEESFAGALEDLQGCIAENGARITHMKLPVVHADKMQMQRVFVNLLGNALKFRGERTPEIQVSAHRCERKERAGVDRPCWVISVKDNGIGIARENWEKIFGLFERLHGKSEYPGSGIGLAICQKIIERLGGAIWVESEPGTGSTFHFSLPLAVESE